MGEEVAGPVVTLNGVADRMAPAGVDPCGERGEFHTFVWDAPGFSAPIDIETGEIVERDGFVFRDVVHQ